MTSNTIDGTAGDMRKNGSRPPPDRSWGMSRPRTFRTSSSWESFTFGESAEGRPLKAHRRAYPGPRALVIAGQHGDEPLAVEATEALIRDDLGRGLEGLELTLVPRANPDGLAAGRRLTAQGWDLNRDHLLLNSPEARALHRLARQLRPEFVVDAHCFKGRRRALRAHGFEHAADVLLATSHQPPRWSEHLRLHETVERQLAECSEFRVGRYFVAGARSIRTSSFDILDARNGLAGGHNALGVLIEGREPTRRLGSPGRTRDALILALQQVLRSCRTTADVESTPPSVLTDGRWAQEEPLMTWQLPTGRSNPIAQPLSVRQSVVPRRTEPPAAGYFVHPASPMLEVLKRHGCLRSIPPPHLAIEEATITRLRRSTRSGAPLHRIELEWAPASEVSLASAYAYFQGDIPTARLLEPSSRYGLHRFPKLAPELSEGCPHPVLRARFKSLAEAPLSH